MIVRINLGYFIKKVRLAEKELLPSHLKDEEGFGILKVEIVDSSLILHSLIEDKSIILDIPSVYNMSFLENIFYIDFKLVTRFFLTPAIFSYKDKKREFITLEFTDIYPVPIDPVKQDKIIEKLAKQVYYKKMRENLGKRFTENVMRNEACQERTKGYALLYEFCTLHTVNRGSILLAGSREYIQKTYSKGSNDK